MFEDYLSKKITKENLKDIKIDTKSINRIAELSSGDLRSAYNLLEVAYYSSSNKEVNLDVIKKILIDMNTPDFVHDNTLQISQHLLS